MGPSILIIEDESVLRRSLAKYFAKYGYDVYDAASGEAGVELFAGHILDAAVVDLKLPGIDGLATLKRIKEIEPSTVVVMMTAFGDVEPAVAAIKSGAYDYVKKPFEPDDMRRLLDNALRASRVRQELAALKDRQSRKYGYVVCESPAMKRVMALADRLSRTARTPGLIVGETGTGKEVIAREVHSRSDRADGRFVAVNCSALSETLLESELFGHVKGAFTDARREKRGLFELADGGTLFLDEIGDLRLSLQPRLLRALEERTVRRVGGLQDIPVDVRVVAATNRDLRALVADALFREDLYYRLNVFTIYIPPLRERPEDAAALSERFIAAFNAEFKKNIAGLSPEAAAFLDSYEWPGNARELRNVIERAVILTEGEFILPTAITVRPAAASPARAEGAADAFAIEDVERQHIREILSITGGNRSRAAKLLKISRTTLWSKLKKYGFAEADAK